MPRLIYGLTPEDLATWLAKHGQPGFRLGQIAGWVYGSDAPSFEAMTNLPAALRDQLAHDFTLGAPPILARTQTSETLKLLLELPGGSRVECVRIRMGRTYTACLSTQVGCIVGCVFCSTGQAGCQRNLTAGEIIQQLAALRALTRAERGHHDDPAQPPVSNVVFMGMGEPFLNYEPSVAAVRRMVDRNAYAMSPSRITVSTAGIPPSIRRYATEGLATELAVSLNAPNDALRARVMPGVARWPLSELLEACREFSGSQSGQPVTFAYVLVEGLNDDLDQAIELAKLLRRQPHHLNLIPLNPVSHGKWKAPGKDRINAFVQLAREHGLNASVRHSKGTDIDAACGQLRGRLPEAAQPAAETELAPAPTTEPQPEPPRATPARPPRKRRSNPKR
jgi:23S rRNA (adenine2503-C2)-methyltransferase